MAPGIIAAEAPRIGVPIIHLSTDYLFSGESDRPYEEDDEPAPQCVYGKTKLAGERAVAAANPKHIILRTAWVYSPYGKNFVKTILRLAADRDMVKVVADQWGNPTSALDIADGTHTVAHRLLDRDGDCCYGLYHMADVGTTHRAGFASHVFRASNKLGGPSAIAREISTADYPTKAKRPRNSCLATNRLREAFGWISPKWQISCTEVVCSLFDGM